MIGKRLLALLAAAGVFGLSPVYAIEDADDLRVDYKPYTEQVAAIEGDESFDLTQMAALDELSDEGLAGRPGMDGDSEGLDGVSRFESSDDHWAAETPSGESSISN
jgi:hypothetical protein